MKKSTILQKKFAHLKKLRAFSKKNEKKKNERKMKKENLNKNQAKIIDTLETYHAYIEARSPVQRTPLANRFLHFKIEENEDGLSKKRRVCSRLRK